ncbi:EaD/Ea22-like family protein [Pantoea phage PA-1]
MKFKGTPGPWSVEGFWVESDCRYIAEVHDFREECEIFKPVHPESAANANLIAAAPELLEALQAVLFDVMANRAAINDDRIEEIRAAISKALGQ